MKKRKFFLNLRSYLRLTEHLWHRLWRLFCAWPEHNWRRWSAQWSRLQCAEAYPPHLRPAAHRGPLPSLAHPDVSCQGLVRMDQLRKTFLSQSLQWTLLLRLNPRRRYHSKSLSWLCSLSSQICLISSLDCFFILEELKLTQFLSSQRKKSYYQTRNKGKYNFEFKC